MNKLLSAACALLLGLAAASPVLAQAVTYTDVSSSGERITVPVTPSKPLPVTGGGGGGSLSAKANAASQTSTEGATTDPLSMDLHRSLRVLNMDSAGNVIDPNAALPSGSNTIGTVNLGTINGIALDASVLETHGTKAAGTAATKSSLVGLVFNTSLPTLTTGQQAALQGDSSGRLLNSDTQAQTKLDTLHTDMGLPIPAGTAIIGKVGIDQTTDGTTNAVHLVAGTALAGKVGLDQTTPGTTNAVSLAQVGATTLLVNTGATGAGSPRVTVAVDSATVAGSATLPAGANLIGHTDGAAAALATTSGNPNKVGCVFQTNTTAATTGQNQNVACDAFGNTGKSFTPAMAVQLTAQSATTANTANTATLGGVASKFTYISGFACTSGGATAASLITVTVAGLITGSMTYTMAIPAGATLAASPLIVSFPNPIQASAVNTAITTQIGAAGSGNTVEQCNAQGFQQ